MTKARATLAWPLIYSARAAVTWTHLVDSVRQIKSELAGALASATDKDELVASAQAAEEQAKSDLAETQTANRKMEEKVTCERTHLIFCVKHS